MSAMTAGLQGRRARSYALCRLVTRVALALLFVLVSLGVGVRVWSWRTGAALSFNSTASVPLGFYVLHPPQAPVRSDYVCIAGLAAEAPELLRRAIRSGQTPAEFRWRWLLKRVVALPGDLITYEQDLVHINGVPLANSRIFERNSYGQSMPIADYPRTLQQGEVWLASTDPRGFDSRYFGAVNVAALTCRARPLWTF